MKPSRIAGALLDFALAAVFILLLAWALTPVWEAMP